MREGGQWLLRIEDIDRQRSKPEWERQIYDDLHWLGLRWPEPVMRQSERIGVYEAALSRLWGADWLYACACSRADIVAALSAPQEGVGLTLGPDGLVYPGTCRARDRVPHDETLPDAALRLRMGRCGELADSRSTDGDVFWFEELGQGPKGEHGRIEFTAETMIREVGDVVLARRGMGTSYHLSVVLDDAAQGMTHVIRGQDLFEATKIHVVLQRLLSLPTPTYHHHPLVRDDTGRRLAKREDAKAVARYRAEGATPSDIRRLVGL